MIGVWPLKGLPLFVLIRPKGVLLYLKAKAKLMGNHYVFDIYILHKIFICLWKGWLFLPFVFYYKVLSFNNVNGL